MVYDEESQTISLELAIKTRFGESMVSVDKSTFTSRRVDELKRYGIDFNPKHLSRLLKYVLLSEQNAPIQRRSSICGWSRDGTVFDGFDDGYTGNMDLSTLKTSSDYITELNNLIDKSIGCQLAIMLSLSSATLALLEQYLHTGSPIYHFYGDSSRGKTTALQLAASMWGNPEQGRGLLHSWNATDNAILSHLNGNYGICVCLDESGSARKKDFTNTIYCVNQGIDRARLNKDSQQKPAKHWNTVVLSSGEHSLLDMSNQASGLRARLIEFLDTSITLSASHAENVKNFSYGNYGILGRRWVTVLQSMPIKDLLELHNEWKDYFLDEIDSDKSIVKRLVCLISIPMITAQLVREQLGIALDIEGLTDFWVEYLKQVEHDSLSLADRAYDILIDWLSQNSHTIQKQGECGFSGMNAKMVKPNEVAIRSTVFKKILEDNGFSDVKVVAKALKDADLLHPEMKDGLQCRIVFGNIKVQTYRLILKNESIGMY